MAETKSTFTRGRMNKDLDERLIPAGEYREALNVQVSTSEGSDVGVVQNILGNALLNLKADNSQVLGGTDWDCVGAIADEKNDKLYWFVTHSVRDAILEYDSETGYITPVLVDTNKNVLKFTGDLITGINIISGDDADDEDKLLLWTDNANEPRKINIQRCIDGTTAFNLPTKLIVNNSEFINTDIATEINNVWNGQGTPTTTIEIVNASTLLNVGDQIIQVKTWNFITSPGAGPQIRYITAINGNIVTLSAGIFQGGNWSIGDIAIFRPFEYLKEEHITVIKKNPTTPPIIKLESNTRGSSNLITDINGVDPFDANGDPNAGYIFTVDSTSGVITGLTNTTNGGTQFTVFEDSGNTNYDILTIQKREGDIVDLYIEQTATTVYLGMGVDGSVPAGNQPDVISETNWKVGDILLVQKYDPNDNSGPLQFNYQSRVKVLSKSSPYEINNTGEYEQYFETELIEVKENLTPNPNPPEDPSAGPVLFQVTLEDKEEGIFQKKIPRFAYRYKYEDNEYSTISPWSEPAFLPSGFFYHPTKNPYNLGMVNYTKSITVQDFIPADIPLDVVQVDLLYKEEGSTTVYSIDNFKPNDPVDSGSTNNPWNSIGSTPTNFYNSTIITSKGSYEITSDNVRGAIPGNQLLRPWDNVPRRALAQEVTGNRIVYGNYLQNYDLLTKPIVKAGYRARAISGNDYIDRSVAQKSLKSFRDYQVGVVYGDEYGRETPVFTEDDAAFNVPFGECKDVNQIYASLYGPQPSWADYYKIYVKQVSGEYYNLVMDRVYRAEDDDNLWISFPSSDRNKITEESFISLKKQIDVNNPVTKENKFKVIDIKNEAPEFIKSKHVEITELTSSTSHLANSALVGDVPVSSTKQISFSTSEWTTSFPDLFDTNSRKLNEEPLSFVFYQTTGGITRVSNRYEVSSYSDTGSLIFVFKDAIDEETDNWIASGSSYSSDVSLKLFKEEKINKQEFEGRFFVKIVQDDITEKYLESQIEVEVMERVSGSTDFYYLADENGTYTSDGTPDYQNTHDNFDSTIDEHYQSNEKPEWIKNFDFGLGQVSRKWFIDQTYFKSTQSEYSLDPNDSKDEGPNYFRGIHTITSNSYINGNSNAWEDKPTFYKLGKTYMNISFGCVGEDLHETGGSQAGKDHGELDWGSLRDVNNQFSDSFDETKHRNQWNTNSSIEKKLVAGTKFKFKNKAGVLQETTYEITNVLIRRSYNYMNWGHVQSKINDYQNKEAGIYYSANKGQAALYRMGEFGRKENRRVTFILEIKALGGQPDNPKDGLLYNPIPWDNTEAHSTATTSDTATSNIEFTTTFVDEEEGSISVSPAVWETEPDDLPDLNLYYEASQAYPLSLDAGDSIKGNLLAPIGCRVWCNNPQYNRTSPESNLNQYNLPSYSSASPLWKDPQVMSWNGNEVEIYPGLDVDLGYDDSGSAYWSSPSAYSNNLLGQSNAYVGKVLRFYRPDMSFTSATITGVTDIQINNGAMSTHKVRKVTVDIKKTSGLAWSNCFSFQNGVESNRVRDDFNKPMVSNGVKVSTTIEEPYAEERRGNGLIYSSLYNSTNGINGLNQFIQAEKITKDLNPTYGGIQKLFSRVIRQSSSLIAFCEDRVVSILSNKDALYNADGNPQVVASNAVLGDANAFVGEYGISKDPGSFAKESYRVYFTDRQRGAVLRLSMDGLTPISDAGMSDYFKDNLKPTFKLIGSYDDRKNEYNLTIDSGIQSYPDSTTVSFKEDTKGWVGFKSFIPDYGLSMANNYYTFYQGKLYKHHDENQPRNTFYGIKDNSFIETIFSEGISIIKNFKTLNYEGDAGWTATINTVEQSGTINEFVEKEGKYFNYIKGEDGIIDAKAFNFQGIGTVKTIQ